VNDHEKNVGSASPAVNAAYSPLWADLCRNGTMLGQFFKTFRFEHPKTEQSIIVGGWSYVWAGLFGAFYLLSHGFSSYFLRALVVNIGCLILLVGLTAAPLFLRPLYAVFVLVLAVPVIFIINSMNMVALLKTAYRRRGWMTRIGQ
jgi:hypothetical protein